MERRRENSILFDELSVHPSPACAKRTRILCEKVRRVGNISRAQKKHNVAIGRAGAQVGADIVEARAIAHVGRNTTQVAYQAIGLNGTNILFAIARFENVRHDDLVKPFERRRKLR